MGYFGSAGTGRLRMEVRLKRWCEIGCVWSEARLSKVQDFLEHRRHDIDNYSAR